MIARIALLAAGAALPAWAQSLMPGGTPPAVSLPAKLGSPPRQATVEPRTVLRGVTILRGKTSVEVHIEASAPVTPAVMRLSQPERIVVDLAGVGCGGGHHFPVNAGDVEGVRVALFRSDPPVTRVVVDLSRRQEYRLLAVGSTVILAIDFRLQPALTAAPVPAAPALTTPPPPLTALPPPADVPVPAPIPDAKLLPQPAEPPPAAQPSEPAVSTTIPQVTTLPVPTSGEEETTAHQVAKNSKPGVLRKVTVSREKNAIAVRIEGSKPLQASAATLSNPERIVIDLADVRLKRPQRIAVNAADVQEVSTTLFLVNPLVTRVVVELARPHAYHLQPSGDSITLRIETDEVKSAGPQPVR